eukprot:6933297-Prymnesium_polylepis.1
MYAAITALGPLGPRAGRGSAPVRAPHTPHLSLLRAHSQRPAKRTPSPRARAACVVPPRTAGMVVQANYRHC